MLRPEDHVAEAMGVGQRSIRWWRVNGILAWIVTAGALGFAGYLYVTKPPLIPYVLAIDDETRVLATLTAKQWQPGASAYADVARRWIWLVRSYPTEELTRQNMLTEARRITALQLYEQMGKLTDATKAELRKFEGIEVAPEMRFGKVTVEADRATVEIEWRERKYNRGGAGPWSGARGTVELAHLPAANTGELAANPSGIYVTGFLHHEIRPVVAETGR